MFFVPLRPVARERTDVKIFVKSDFQYVWVEGC